MTTIITDGKQIAHDSLLTSGGERDPEEANKVIRDGGLLFAIAGNICFFQPLVEWYKDGAIIEDVPKCPDDYSYTFWVFDPEQPKPLVYNPRCPYPETLSFPDAIGSGRKYALGALRAGVTLKRAVQIAVEYDIYSGGRIKLQTLPKLAEKGAQSVSRGNKGLRA